MRLTSSSLPRAGFERHLDGIGRGRNPTTSIAAISDGTSNTLMVGEYATNDDTNVSGALYRADWGASWG